MESEAVRRRINLIASHFADSTSSPTPHLLLPLKCSAGSLKSAVPRCDRSNRICFARQGSASQGSFMRQCEVNSERDQKRATASSGSANKEAAPLFSRPNCKDMTELRGSNRDFPMFARPITRTHHTNYLGSSSSQSQSHGGGSVTKWSPTMKVVDYGKKYVVIMEIPGVNVNEIRVEVHDKHLRIMGKQRRSGQQYVRGIVSAYEYQKQTLEGSFMVAWPLPQNVNKDSVSAHFLDGFLHLNIPKLELS